jgi:hypothetical protein
MDDRIALPTQNAFHLAMRRFAGAVTVASAGSGGERRIATE